MAARLIHKQLEETDDSWSLHAILADPDHHDTNFIINYHFHKDDNTDRERYLAMVKFLKQGHTYEMKLSEKNDAQEPQANTQ